MITAKIKDNVLSVLTSNLDFNRMYNLNTKRLMEDTWLDFKTLNLVLNLLSNDFMLSDVNIRSDVTHLVVRPDAFGFIEKGGYSEIERIENLQKKKLELDVKALEIQLNLLTNEAQRIMKSNPTTAERILAVVANISNIAGLAGTASGIFGG